MGIEASSIKTIEHLSSAAIVSEIDSGRVVYLNEEARDYYKIAEVPENTKSLELLKLQGDDLDWYMTVNLTAQIEKFQPIQKKADFPVVLDCCAIEMNGTLYRLDVFNTKNYDEMYDYNQYAYTFERSVNRLEKLYKGIASLEDNIRDILDLVLYTYAGDRAFVYEVDEELCCTVDTYERCRMGFVGHNEKYKSLDRETIQLLMNQLERGDYYAHVTERVEDLFIRERMEKGLVVRVMTAPFTRRSGMHCFLCIDNPRRFWKKGTFLRYASYMLANDIHVNKIQGHLNASYMLNRSLLNDSEDCVKIYMLGGFTIQTSNGIQQDGSFRSPQVCALISFLLLNRKRMLSIYEISEAIWPEQIIDNPYNQIKNVVFRARKALEGVCNKPLIEAKDGTYMINRSLDIWIDTEEFERLCKKADREDLPVEQRLSIYESAFKLYKGGMLPFIEPELWLLTRINYYQLLYTNMVNKYVQLLSEKNRYTEAFSIASTAISIEPSNFDIYDILLSSMLKNSHDDLARKYYQKIYTRVSKNQKEQFRQMWKNLNENR